MELTSTAKEVLEAPSSACAMEVQGELRVAHVGLHACLRVDATACMGLLGLGKKARGVTRAMGPHLAVCIDAAMVEDGAH